MRSEEREVKNGKRAESNNLYSLIALDDFKTLMGIDDREEKLARFCLVTSTLTIEQYCKRKFLKKQYFEQIEFSGSLFLPLREYPVCKILAAFAINSEQVKMNNYQLTVNNEKRRINNGERRISNEERDIRNWEIIEPEFYRVIPDLGTDLDIPFAVELSPATARFGCNAIKVVYWAGYSNNSEQVTGNKVKKNTVPADLAAACLELASWNMSRYKGRRVGMTGNIKGSGKEGEHFEMSMPTNVCNLLEAYKRRVI